MSSRKTRIISIASGKGGVGKSSLSVNIAWQLASTGHRVCLIDADLGLANVDIILNISPEYSLENVIFDDLPLEKAILPVHPNLDVISGGSGVARLASLTKAKRLRLFNEFKALDQYDYILMDNSPGIAPQVISFCLSSRELVIVLNPEATSLTDGYALIKVLKENGLQYSPLLILNKSRGQKDSKKIYDKINTTCQKYLQTQVTYLGDVPRDEYYEFPPRNGGALVELYPLSEASRAIVKIADRLTNRQRPELYTMEPEDFWEKSIVQYQQRKEDPAVKQATEQLAPTGYNSADEILDRIDFLLNELGTLSEQGKFDARKLNRKMNIAGQKLNLLSYKNGLTPLPAAPYTSVQPEKNVRNIGLACPDLTMKIVLKEIIELAGFKTIDVLEDNIKVEDVNMTLFCLEKPDEKVSGISEKLNGKPAILIAGFQYDLLLPALNHNVKMVIQKPFTVTGIQSAIEEMATAFHA